MYVPAMGGMQQLYDVVDADRKKKLWELTEDAIQRGRDASDVVRDGEHLVPSLAIMKRLRERGIEYKVYQVDGKQFLAVPSVVGEVLSRQLKREEDLFIRAEVVELTPDAMHALCCNKVVCNPQGPAEVVSAFITVHQQVPIKAESFLAAMCVLADMDKLPPGLPNKLRATFGLSEGGVIPQEIATRLRFQVPEWNEVYNLSKAAKGCGCVLTTLHLLMTLALVGPEARAHYIGYVTDKYKELEGPKQMGKNPAAVTLETLAKSTVLQEVLLLMEKSGCGVEQALERRVAKKAIRYKASTRMNVAADKAQGRSGGESSGVAQKRGRAARAASDRIESELAAPPQPQGVSAPPSRDGEHDVSDALDALGEQSPEIQSLFTSPEHPSRLAPASITQQGEREPPPRSVTPPLSPQPPNPPPVPAPPPNVRAPARHHRKRSAGAREASGDDHAPTKRTRAAGEWEQLQERLAAAEAEAAVWKNAHEVLSRKYDALEEEIAFFRLDCPCQWQGPPNDAHTSHVHVGLMRRDLDFSDWPPDQENTPPRQY